MSHFRHAASLWFKKRFGKCYAPQAQYPALLCQEKLTLEKCSDDFKLYAHLPFWSPGCSRLRVLPLFFGNEKGVSQPITEWSEWIKSRQNAIQGCHVWWNAQICSYCVVCLSHLLPATSDVLKNNFFICPVFLPKHYALSIRIFFRCLTLVKTVVRTTKVHLLLSRES